jgi:hypothetical protein
MVAHTTAVATLDTVCAPRRAVQAVVVECPRKLRFAVSGSLLASTLVVITSGCDDDAEPVAVRDGEVDDETTSGDGESGTFGETIVVNPGPQLDLGTPPVDPELDVATPPPPPVVNPGRVADLR